MPLTNSYITLAQLKAWLGLSDTVDDTLLEIAANAASRQIDRYTNRRFYLDAAASARTFRATSGGVLWVDDIGSLTGLVVKTDLGDDGTYETTWASTDYETGPANAIALGQPITHLRPTCGRLRWRRVPRTRRMSSSRRRACPGLPGRRRR